jgi:hypothetical protein
VSALARRAPAWTITAALGLLYVILAPPSGDLAAAGYRSDLFTRAGFTIWDNSWYGGHHLPAYSVLAPGLSSQLGPQLLTAISMTVAAALFAAIVRGRFQPPAARIAAIWFAYGAAIGLLANRVPFDLGLAIGLGALLAAQHARRAGGRRAWLVALALALAALCPLASPIAGVFLALAAVAWVLAQRSPIGLLQIALVLAALVPIALLAVAFPEGGSEPFAASAFYPALGVVLLLAALIPASERELRIGALLYAAALIGAYLIPTAIGGNADRLGALLAGPIAACALAHRARQPGAESARATVASALWRMRLLIVLAPFLIYWQSDAPISDLLSATSDPSVPAAYYAPLLGELETLGVGYAARPARIEVVPTRDHSEARWVAAKVMIARGWERQLDSQRNKLFYEGSKPLSAQRYRSWLSDEAVSYVALPNSPLDYAAKSEARLIQSAPPYLREVWRSEHWRLFEVRSATPLAQPPSVLEQLDDDSFTLRTSSAGTFTVRVRFTPYWALAAGHGCVSRGAGDWTQVQARGAGSLHVVIDFSLARVFQRGARCR